ncbi:MAG: hypothetical protein WKF37_09000 [Bryobacteraceae bacterium]
MTGNAVIIRLQRTNQGVIRGPVVANQFEIRVDGKLVKEFKAGGGAEFVSATRRAFLLMILQERLFMWRRVAVRVPVKAYRER